MQSCWLVSDVQKSVCVDPLTTHTLLSQVEATTLQTADKNGADINKESEEKDVAPDAVDRNAHPLQFTYTIWFNRRVQGARTQENYEKNIKKVGSFSSVCHFTFM